MENKSNISLGEFLKKMRELKGASLADVESATALSRSYINRLENKNRDNPTLYSIGKLCNYYEMPFSVFAKFCNCDNQEGQIQNLDFIMLNTEYLFAGIEVDVAFKMTFCELIRELENYCTKASVSRQDEAKIVDIAVKLRDLMLGA